MSKYTDILNWQEFDLFKTADKVLQDILLFESNFFLASTFSLTEIFHQFKLFYKN